MQRMPKPSPASPLPAFNPANDQTFFDVEIGETKGRVVFELFTK